MRTVVFDLDGTLADTSADLIAAANSCFRARGLGDLLDPVADARTAFRGARAMLSLGFSRSGTGGAAEVEDDFPRLVDAYSGALDVHSRLYPGARAAVERLAQAGYATAVCTNKPEGLADRLLESLGVRGLFGALVGADTLTVRKPDPAPLVASVERAGGDPGRALLVGDTETDRETARAAGVPCVLVTFGPDGRGVAALAPEALLDHFDGLDALVAELVG
ncbi:MAG TPA: haloacid dehalogenase [Rhodobacteraceae bacterium]|mgnify:CR=1 FL=1|nr:haloacid dehalogenase [Paracoccaceae bacterium]